MSRKRERVGQFLFISEGGVERSKTMNIAGQQILTVDVASSSPEGRWLQDKKTDFDGKEVNYLCRKTKGEVYEGGR